MNGGQRLGREPMGFYQDQIVPLLINLAMRHRKVAEYRGRVVPGADGRVLEVGIGSGLNLPFYGPGVRHVIGLEPSAKLLEMAGRAADAQSRRVSFIKGSAESIPLDRASVDTVVTTYTLCTIPDAPRALAEMRRVLRPGGRMLFSEHGRAPDDGVKRWQERLNPVWKKIGGGCNLNRPMDELISGAGFALHSLETMYLPGPRPMTFTYWGAAERA